MLNGQQSLSIPSGFIGMWKGSVATIPTGWVLCDGNNGTPDLRNRFIAGAQEDDGGVAKTAVLPPVLLQSGGTDNHQHTGTTDNNSNYSTGYPGGSGDPDFAVWDHAHNFTTGSEYHIPPFYALCFIMKV